MTTSAERTAGPLVEWLLSRGLLRGPHLYVDYWASVLALEGIDRTERAEADLVDRGLFRIGLDRPDLEVRLLRYYLTLFLLGPLLLAFRSARRLGRFTLRLGPRADAVVAALEPYLLELDDAGDGRVDVRSGERLLGQDVLDPRRVSAFASLFLTTYRVPLASLTAILLVAISAPILQSSGTLDAALAYWIPLGYPALVLVLFAIYRDWTTALIGAAPVIVGRFLVSSSSAGNWLPLWLSMAGLFVLYLIVDWFFTPRPVPPVLLFYSAEGDANPYERRRDVPYWLEGRAYWVWRYLMLTPAEINKPWEKDWERVELWVRADGPEAGALEWAVTDAHYRELWIPFARLGASEDRLGRHRDVALRHAREDMHGLWLVEVDMNALFHTPRVRTVSFVPEERGVHARSLWHLLSVLFKRGELDDPDDYTANLDRLRIERGKDVLDDLPEVVVNLAARYMLATPWTHVRYPLGAQRRWAPRLYDASVRGEPPAAADPTLQIKTVES